MADREPPLPFLHWLVLAVLCVPTVMLIGGALATVANLIAVMGGGTSTGDLRWSLWVLVGSAVPLLAFWPYLWRRNLLPWQRRTPRL